MWSAYVIFVKCYTSYDPILKCNGKAGKLVLLVDCLPQNHEDPSSISRTHILKKREREQARQIASGSDIQAILTHIN